MARVKLVNMEQPQYSIVPHNNYHKDVSARMPRSTEACLPSASVVIPTYNKLPLLRRCVAAVANQHGDLNYEVAIVDDGSTDGTREWAETVEEKYPQLEGRFHYTWWKDDGYQLAKARNTGVSMTSNDIVVFLDADLIPSPAWLQAHLSPYSAAENICVTGIYYNVDPAPLSLRPTLEELESHRVCDRWRGKMGDWRERDIADSDNLNRSPSMPVWYMVCGGNTSYHRGRLVDAGAFDPNFRGWGAEDNDMAFRYYSNGNRIIPSFSALAYHQDHPFDRKLREKQVQNNVKLLRSKTQPPKLTCVVDDRDLFYEMESNLGAWVSAVGGKVELVWAGRTDELLPRWRHLRFASVRLVRDGLQKAISTARAPAIAFPSVATPGDLSGVGLVGDLGVVETEHVIMYSTKAVWGNWPKCMKELDREVLSRSVRKEEELQ